MFDLGVESSFEITQYNIVTFENNNINGQTNDASVSNERNVTESFFMIVIVFYLEERMANFCGTIN